MTAGEPPSAPRPAAGAAVRFELSGGEVEVRYLSSQAPQLNHRDGDAEHAFTAAQLRIEPTVLGSLATGTVESVPDLGDLTVTLAVPDVNLRDGESAQIETFLVRTRHRTSIAGPSLVDGAVQSYELVPLSGTAVAAEEAPGSCRDWAAVHDLEPPGPGRLRVTGRCTLHPRARVELRRKEPQGVNPADLLLEKIVHTVDDYPGETLVEVDVEYGEQTDARIDTVTILPDGVSIPVQRAL